MKWLIALLFSSFIFLSPLTTYAIECGDPIPVGDSGLLQEYEDKCKAKIESLQQEQGTLNAAISTINSKINLAQGQIAQTEAQINALKEEIGVLSTLLTDLNFSLDDLSTSYIARVRESYKQRTISPIHLFFSSKSFSEFLEKARYLNVVKTRDHLILMELEKARADYDNQKQLKEEKQAEVEKLMAGLEAQKRALGGQKQQKQDLLVITQNSEKKFQALLNSARSELEAIQGIIAGKGIETEVGDISQGEKIASVISGSSCNSSGTHLHFMITENSSVQNPFNYLQSVNYENCSGSSCDSSDGDSFNPSGSWSWPLNPTIKMNQGFGVTWAINNTWVSQIYSFHNGIDIVGSSLDVKAVQAGKLYRGSYSGSSGCALKYVRVDHKDSSTNSFYLHVDYF